MGAHGQTKDFEWSDMPKSLRALALFTLIGMTAVVFAVVVFGALWLFNLPPFPVPCKP